jgi:hypothetical protein
VPDAHEVRDDMRRLLGFLGHLAALALVAAIAAYWAIKILTPPPASAPPPLATPPPREPDPVLAARMFGLVQMAPVPAASNVQVAGVFAAGADSSAVLIVDGKPARVYLLGQEVAPGTTLAAVRADGITLASGSGQQELRVPPRPVAPMGGAAPAPVYTREGNTLSAPGVGPAAPPRPLPPPQSAPANPAPMTQPGVMPPGRAMMPGAPPEPAPAPTVNPAASQ